MTQSNYAAQSSIGQRIAELEAELIALKNQQFQLYANRNYQGVLGTANYQSQHYCNESQSEYFGKK